MNFSTECLEHLILHRKVLIEDGLNVDLMALEATAADLLASVKYLVPSPGKLNVTVKKEALKFLRLPYPICAFEYSCPEAKAEGVKGAKGFTTGKSSKRIALAYDCSKDVGPIPMLKRVGMIPKDSTGILVQSLYYIDSANLWAPSYAAGYVDEHTGDHDAFLLTNTQLNFTIDAIPLMVQSLMEHFGHLQGRDMTMVMLNDVSDEVGMAVRTCLLLNTRNLKVVKAIEAPAALNKKRAKKGRPPFFEYRTLDIFISDTGTRLARKRVDPAYVRNLFANMHADRKWGTVTGHFKTRATGIWWWNSHTRGKLEKGAVVKEYQLRKGTL